MSQVDTLRVTVRFLQPFSHGRGEDGAPEWPPSPLRLFQALTANSIGREVVSARRDEAEQTLRWLERCGCPEIVAPRVASSGTPFRAFVPDNVADEVARAWVRGTDADIAEYRTEKDVRALRLDGEAVHYVFRRIEHADAVAHADVLRRMCRSLTHLGWGVDMVAGDASIDADPVAGERWLPGHAGGRRLRVPTEGTFDALEARHARSLERLSGGVFNPVPALTTFRTERYARASDAPTRPFAAFRMVHPETQRRFDVDPVSRTRDVAAWVRHAVGTVAADWPYGKTRWLVHGHGGESEPQGQTERFSFLPLPTINGRLRRVESVSRVLVVGPPGYERHLGWLEARLAGYDLVWRDRAVAFLDPLPSTDWVLGRYVETAESWSTVTPVVLPGHDDGSGRKAERLLRKALAQAGFEREIIDGIRELDWRKAGFRPGVEHANRYHRPDKVTGPLFHVRIRFGAPIRGPLALGSGRHRGMGVFAVEL